MKKKVLIVFLFLLTFSLIFISAQNETTGDMSTRGYSCLEGKVKDKCSSLSTEEKTFSLLAIGECKSELSADSSSNQCWPKSGCTIKATAQAILALSKSGTDTKQAEDWLISHNTTPSGMDWLLQIESNNITSCTITYGSATPVNITVNDDKTLSGNAGSCLTVYNNYWFRVSQSCYGQEFKVSCDKSFLTTLLYKKTTSDVIYVSGDTHTASAGGTTAETVSSFCFATSSLCDYEGSLWASIVLDYRGYDVSSYLPYIITMMDEPENRQYLPESFLYSLTSNFRNELLLKQLPEGSWKVSDDKFYDTAVALLPFQAETITEKTTAINWLGGVQGTDGCWNSGNTRDTAFILYSIWPRAISGVEVDEGCEESGGYCMSQMSCSDIGGEILSSYTDCFGASICCSKKKTLASCSEQGGKICAGDEECSVSTVEASDTSICCVGTCEIPEVAISECEQQAGFCKTSCTSREKEIAYSCPSPDVCCVAKKSSGVWIIVLLIILIILAVLGIIFRKQLRELFIRFKTWFKSKFRKGKGKAAPAGPGPRFPPTSSVRVPSGLVSRRIIPQQAQRPQAPPARAAPVKQPAKKTEFDEVLKRLKEIGK